MKFPNKKYKKLSDYFSEYKSKILKNLDEISAVSFYKILNLVEKKILSNSNIFLCGNGGSASIANHYIVDFLKVLRNGTNLRPKFYSLVSDTEAITAIANDVDYSEIFKYQLECLSNKNDLVIFVSSSGNSLNIRKALDYCKEKKIKSVGFTGFDGGYLKKNASISIHVQIKNYGVVEDVHQILMHIMMQFIRQKYMKNDVIKKLIF